MKRARPKQHYRVIKTKKGRKRVLVNKGIKKISYYSRHRKRLLENQREWQKERGNKLWAKKWAENPSFKKKRRLRDHSRYDEKIKDQKSLEGKVCARCGAKNDLQRHHSSYKSFKTIILCRKCHNKEHEKMKR